MRRVLVVDDDKAVREALGQTLELAEKEPVLVGSFIEAKDHLSADFPGIVLSDIRMPGKDGFALLDHAQSLDRDLPVILLTGAGDIPMAVRGITQGAFDFLEKPCAPADLMVVVDKALRTRALVLENRRLKRQVQQGDAAARMLYGQSEVAEALRERVRAAARSSAGVLVSGEPGTGIPKVAEVIHLLSAASMHPFVKLTAGSADADRLDDGFQRAEGGTLFLDEVAALGPAAQFALLERLDGEGRARVIAGTHGNLAEAVAAGRFLPDLYYKLDALRVRIPALRERPEDIPVLFRQYLTIACEQAALPEPEISPEVMARIVGQDWPGNARALMNAAMRFALGLGEAVDDGGAETGLADQLAQVERTLLQDALRRHSGNATQAATGLKLPRKTFYDKLARYGIKPEDFR